MNAREIDMLVFALQMGWKAINEIMHFADCEDLRNDYFIMIQKIEEKTGLELAHDID